MRQFCVYILSNRSGTLYVGVTNDLVRRVSEHKQKLVPGFTTRYNIDRLVYYEVFSDAMSAIEREKQIKGWARAKKLALIRAQNAEFRDLADQLVADNLPSTPAPVPSASPVTLESSPVIPTPSTVTPTSSTVIPSAARNLSPRAPANATEVEGPSHPEAEIPRCARNDRGDARNDGEGARNNEGVALDGRHRARGGRP